jgi:hypothetical protein
MSKINDSMITTTYWTDSNKGEIHCELIDPYVRTITREILKTKEAYIRAALIALGWTPPPEYCDHGVSLDEMCARCAREAEQSKPCPHGNLAHECNDCMIEGDFQYDAAREGR